MTENIDIKGTEFESKRDTWRRLTGCVSAAYESVIVNRRLVRVPGLDYFTLSAIDNDFDVMRQDRNVGVIYHNSYDLAQYNEVPSAGDLGEIFEAWDVIPDDVDVVYCISANEEISVDDLPFDWDKATLLFSTRESDDALIKKSAIMKVTADSPHMVALDTENGWTGLSSLYSFEGNDEEALHALARLYVGRCAYECAWLYSNIAREYNCMWHNGWDAGYISSAVDFCTSGIIKLDPEDVRGYRDAFIRSEYQTILFDREIRERFPRLHDLGNKIEDCLWMLEATLAGIKMAETGDALKFIREKMAETAFDERVRAVVENGIDPRDLMAGSYDAIATEAFRDNGLWVHKRSRVN